MTGRCDTPTPRVSLPPLSAWTVPACSASASGCRGYAGPMPTPRSIRLVRVPATASRPSASRPREKCTVQAEPNPSASARTTCSTTSDGGIRVPVTSPPTPAAIRMLQHHRPRSQWCRSLRDEAAARRHPAGPGGDFSASHAERRNRNGPAVGKKLSPGPAYAPRTNPHCDREGSKTMLIGGQDILLPTTMVGNYPNPRWYDGHGFATLPRGEFIHDSISKEAFEDVVGAIVHDQEAAGLDVISDGKVYGGDSPYGTILYYYLERVSGYKLTGPPIGLPIYSTLYSPTCVGEVRREYPFHIVNLRAVRKATNKPVKVSYTGLGVIAAATTNLHYKDTREVALALAKAFNEDFKELADNGCDIIQLDEFVCLYGMGDWEIDALHAAVEGVNCQFWVHTCWGNYSGTPAYFPDQTETEFGAFVLDKRASDAPAPERAYAIFPHVLNANIDALNYEVGRTGPDDLKPLSENNWTKPFAAGVIDVKSTVTESADQVADRIRQVLEYVPAERLGLSTDCGLINLPRMIAAGKLRALADGAAQVRAEIQG